MYTKSVKALKRHKRLSFVLLSGALLVAVFVVLIHMNDTEKKLIRPPENAIYRDSTQPIEARVSNLLSYMTLEEKIGQMSLVEKNSVKELGHISAYGLGGLLSGSGAKPQSNTAAGWKEMIDTYQEEAVRSRLGIPLLYGSDAIHGHAHVAEMTVFPHMIGLGATRNPDLVQQIAEATAKDMLATGVNWNFSPNLDQPEDIRWGRTYEAFSDDPVLVSELGVAYMYSQLPSTIWVSAV